MEQRELLLRYFFNRMDCVAVQAPWGKPCPVDAAGIVEQLIDCHLCGNSVDPIRVSRMDAKHRGETLTGRFRIGTYAPDRHGKTRWLCLDFDGANHASALADPWAAVIATKRVFDSYGIPTYLEMSGGGQGWHLWVFFCDPMPAREVRLLALRLIPGNIQLANGGSADPQSGLGIEVFPKQNRIAKTGYGNLVWLPWWCGAKRGANQFYGLRNGEQRELLLPDWFETADESTLARVLAEPRPCPDSHSRPRRSPRVTTATTTWDTWRATALASLRLEDVYGTWLTNRKHGEWLVCRDPGSNSGDRHPSAGVADGTGIAERGSFHSFLSGRTVSVFDFLIARGLASDFKEACKVIAELSGVAMPKRGRM